MILLRQKMYSPGKVAEVVSKSRPLKNALGSPKNMEELGIQEMTTKIKTRLGKGLADAKKTVK